MYEELVKQLRTHNGWALNKTLAAAADAIEAQDRHILTLQHEMMAEAECHIADVKRLNKQIEKLQADVRPVVRSKWRGIGKTGRIFVCSACDKTFPYKTSYCPNCGADMREES